ncbi:orotidine-5'-phosphate decarboxylase [Bacteroidales bacterium OttesenSCG-928-E04]|nr:orotidine-5'-phosphate decarboxylase [Bacteroidales bacterium OttesenSCG-928-E04]MDL2326558.1 orotidine-5'-phosphate decarboxylase [Bacteroidales bacterium OttesenSCG-928-A14]
MIIDKLFENVTNNGHVCVGLDTDFSYLPDFFRNRFATIGEALFQFNREIIDATVDVAACFKVQIAYYEAYGMEGMRAYQQTLAYLREINAVIIADVKRGDIAKTAEMYAKAHFTGDFECDFMTINPYMGFDSITPYLPFVKEQRKGLFVLIRTSNEGAKDIEYLPVEGGERVYNVVGAKLNSLGKEYLGKCNFSSIGGVMGCTHADEAVKVRKDLDSTFFLIPGYGAQGGKAEDIAHYLKQGNGGVVNASRSILLAYRKIDNGERDFAAASRQEAIRMRDDIRTVLT